MRLRSGLTCGQSGRSDSILIASAYRREVEGIVARLERIDTASSKPWTTRYLQLIAIQPGIVSRVLALQVESEVPPFKRRVRQLKELGLTESLEVGYRLSPRGRGVLKRLVSESAGH